MNLLSREEIADFLVRLMAGASLREAARGAGIAKQSGYATLIDFGCSIVDADLPRIKRRPSATETDVDVVQWESVVYGVPHTAVVMMSTRTRAIVAHGVARTDGEARAAVDTALVALNVRPVVRDVLPMTHLIPVRRAQFWKKIETFRSFVALVSADHNLCRASQDGATPAMREGVATRPWTTEDLVTVVLDCGKRPCGSVDPACAAADRVRRTMAKDESMLPVFGELIPLDDLALLSGRRAQSIVQRMRQFRMTPEQAAFGTGTDGRDAVPRPEPAVSYWQKRLEFNEELQRDGCSAAERFEAAARKHNSISGASRELGITAPTLYMHVRANAALEAVAKRLRAEGVLGARGRPRQPSSH